jgi:ribosomal protein L20A (L18A)
MKNYEVTGTYAKKGKVHKFTKTVLADDKEKAKEACYSLIGGKQKIKRKDIAMTEIKEAS